MIQKRSSPSETRVVVERERESKSKLSEKISGLLHILLYQVEWLLKTERYKKTVKLLGKINENDKFTDMEKEHFRKFLSKRLYKAFCYDFMARYDLTKPKIYMDTTTGLHYVLTNEDRRLYFRRDMPKKEIKKLYSFLCAEQDTKSPHYYDFDGQPKFNTVLVDIGAAEGNYSLKHIERLKKIYLFECENEWIEALKATFEPYKDKVVIIKNYVSDIDNGTCVTLDSYFTDKEKPDMVKMDVEGAEESVLRGAKELLKKQDISVLKVCTYHRHNDSIVLSQILENFGYSVSYSQGWMIFQDDFRKGLLSAKKTIL